MSAAAELALRSSLLLAATWAIVAAIDKSGASAARRHAVWMGGFASLALLPLLAVLLPPLPLAVVPAAAAAQAPAEFVEVLPVVKPAAQGGLDLAAVLQLAYGALAALLVTRIAIGRSLLERLWRRATPVADPRALTLTGTLCLSLGIRRNIGVRLAADAHIPVTWGSLRPRILLPATATDWSQDRWRSVLLHELGHIARYDSLGRIAVEAICALYWLNPAIWLAARKLRLAQEQACDDLVLAHGAPAVTYARQLLDSAGDFSHANVAVAMATRTDLEQRLRAILEPASRRRAGTSFLASVALVTACTAPVIAAVSLQPATAPMAEQLAPVGRPANAPLRPVALPMPPQAPPRHRPRAMVASAEPVTAPQQPETHDAELARYHHEVAGYAADVERYSGEVGQYRVETNQYQTDVQGYRADKDKYQRDLAAYRSQRAALGPHPPAGTVLPTPPTPPSPTSPTRPTPPTPPTPPST